MKPKIGTITKIKLIGKRIIISLSDNKTNELLRNFMPRRKEIKNNIGIELYSLQVYDDLYFINFNPSTEFGKWATIEVKDFNTVPSEMETITLSGGLYAVFLNKEDASTGPESFNIFSGFGYQILNTLWTIDHILKY